MIVIVFVYQLKVLDTRFIYSAIEIKYKGLDLLVPLWWFVKEEHDPLCIVNLKLLLNRLVFIIGLPDSLGAVEIDHRQEHFHSAWTL